MDESKVLSTEEVDALLKVAQEDSDLATLTNASPAAHRQDLNGKALANITELTWSECEKVLSAFLRKKIAITSKQPIIGKLAEYLDHKKEKYVYSVYHLMPNSYFSLIVLSLPLLHQMINLLFGGNSVAGETPMEAPGKIGMMVAEKVSDLFMEGFSLACKEYGSVTYTEVKAVTLPNLISKLSMDDEVFSLEYNVNFGEIETALSIVLPLEYLQRFIPPSVVSNDDAVQTRTNLLWRAAIENQVVDSSVTLVVALPEVTMSAKELMALKDGDLIPIGDPTAVNVCLNEVKLFYATAAQSNATRVVKILGDV